MTDKYQQLSVKERIANWVTKFPDELAGPLLHLLGHEQPDILAYYPELDRKIQMMLQKMLGDLGYSHVTVQSIDNEGSISGYPYVYQLIPRQLDPEWAEQYLPNVFKALLKATHTTDIDFAYNLEKRRAFVKLRPNNRMHVPVRNAAFMQD